MIGWLLRKLIDQVMTDDMYASVLDHLQEVSNDMPLPELPSTNILLARLVTKGEQGHADALKAQELEIKALPVTYNCPAQEA